MIFDYKCSNSACNFTDEYFISSSLPKDMEAPMICPQCHEGKMLRQFSPQRTSFDIVGYCYENVYGKKNWKKHLSVGDQAKVLTGEKDPY